MAGCRFEKNEGYHLRMSQEDAPELEMLGYNRANLVVTIRDVHFSLIRGKAETVVTGGLLFPGMSKYSATIRQTFDMWDTDGSEQQIEFYNFAHVFFKNILIFSPGSLTRSQSKTCDYDL